MILNSVSDKTGFEKYNEEDVLFFKKLPLDEVTSKLVN